MSFEFRESFTSCLAPACCGVLFPCLPSVFNLTGWLILLADPAPLGSKLLWSASMALGLWLIYSSEIEILCSVSTVMCFPLHIPYSLKESWSKVFLSNKLLLIQLFAGMERVWCFISAYAVNGTSILAKIWLVLCVWPRKDDPRMAAWEM